MSLSCSSCEPLTVKCHPSYPFLVHNPAAGESHVACTLSGLVREIKSVFLSWSKIWTVQRKSREIQSHGLTHVHHQGNEILVKKDRSKIIYNFKKRFSDRLALSCLKLICERDSRACDLHELINQQAIVSAYGPLLHLLSRRGPPDEGISPHEVLC